MMTFDFCVIADCSIWVSYTHSKTLSLECCLTWLSYIFSKQDLLTSCTSFCLLLTFGWSLFTWSFLVALVTLTALDFSLLLTAASPTSSTTKALIQYLIINKLQRLKRKRNYLMNYFVKLFGLGSIFDPFPNLFVFHVCQIQQIVFHKPPNANFKHKSDPTNQFSKFNFLHLIFWVIFGYSWALIKCDVVVFETCFGLTVMGELLWVQEVFFFKFLHKRILI